MRRSLARGTFCAPSNSLVSAMRFLVGMIGAAMLLGLTGRVLAADDSYLASIQQWRDNFDKDVREGGWLALVGRVKVVEGVLSIGSAPDADVRLSERGPPHLGKLIRKVAQFRFDAAADAGLSVDGKPVSGTIDLPTNPGKGVIRTGTLKLVVRNVGDDFYLLVQDSANPAIGEFKGTTWFPVDPVYRVDAKFTPYDKPEQVRLSLTHVDTKKPMESTGEVTFLLGGKERRLRAFVDEGELFVMFQDPTNGTETYGGGRFLHAPLPRDGVTVLDFNKAFNPYCSVNPYVMCPVPPPGSRLEAPLTAGEKYPQTGGH